MKRLVVLAGVMSALFAQSALADEWRTTQAERLFGPEMSEEEACIAAERKAKNSALKAVSGEQLSSEDLMVCSESEGDAKCDLNQYTWSVIDGEIKGVRNVQRHTEDGVGGYRKCVVQLDVNIGVPKGRPDPSFDMSVGLNASVYRSGDLLKVEITPSAPMYINVFQWLPYQRADKQVYRLFPNPYDSENHFTEVSYVPTAKGANIYDLEVRFPGNVDADKRIVDEYLMVVGTRKDIQFRDGYSLEEFNARLLEIPRSDSRRIKRAYSVVRN